MLPTEPLSQDKVAYAPEQLRWIQEIHEVALRNAQQYGMELNHNVDIVLATCSRLISTDGYCPSVAPAAWNYDTVCPCKNMREHQVCHCSLFVPKETP